MVRIARPHPALVASVAFVLVGCYRGAAGSGDDGDGGDDDAGDDGESADDDDGDDEGTASDCEEQSVAPLRRLSQRQYENTLADLFAPVGIDVAVEVADDLARIPVDDAGTSFGILDRRVSDLHARAFYRLA